MKSNPVSATGESSQQPSVIALDSFLASMPEAVVVFDDLGLIQEANDKALALFGYKRQDMVGAEITLVLPYIDQYLDESLSDFFLEDRPARTAPLLYNVTGVNRKGEEEQLDLFLNIIPDNERLMFCASLRLPHALYSSYPNPSQDSLLPVFAHAAIGMMILDLHEAIVDANPALQRMLDFSRDELVGRSFNEITHKDDVKIGTSLFNELVGGQRDHYQLEKRYVRKDGAPVYCRVTVSLLPDDSGHGAHILSMIEDISERKRTQQALEQAHAELEKRVQERTEALSNANRNLMQQIEQRKRAEKILGETEVRFSIVIDNAPIIIFAVNNAGYLTTIQGKGLELLQRRPEDIVGKTMFELFTPAQAFHQTMNKVLTGQAVSRTIEVDDKVFDLWCAPAKREDGSIHGAIGVMADITDRIRAQEKISASEKDLSTILNNMQDTFYRCDLQGKVTMASPSVRSLLGFSRDEVIGKYTADFYVEPSAHEQFSNLLKQNNGFVYNFEAPLRRKDGSIIWVSTNAHWCRDNAGNVIGIEGVSRDITRTKRTAQRLYYLANYDALTELPNRTLFRDRLKHAMALAKRNNKLVALFFLDIDHFKDINDSLGHVAGDQLLQGVARRIQSCAREGDTVARMGGDEFTVILEGLHEAVDAELVAFKIIEAMANPFSIENHDIYVSPSIGIALYPRHGDNIDDLVRNADTAMYQAKSAGRNNFKFFNADMKTVAIENLMLHNDLRNAISLQQLALYFQPQLDLASGHMVGMEALLRWHHPEQGILHPNSFIPLAEQSGLIVSIDAWVVRSVCEQMVAWRAQGLAPVKVAVNLSALQFQQPGFGDTVRAILQETAADPGLLQFEITESVLISDVDQATRTLRELNGLGINICVDDFGIGYSSLSYLKQFPLHTLKIDRSFIREIGSGGNNETITEAIIGLGHNLKLTVIAEGVEREDQLSFLVPRGCDIVQGYLFSGPCSAADIVEWMPSA